MHQRQHLRGIAKMRRDYVGTLDPSRLELVDLTDNAVRASITMSNPTTWDRDDITRDCIIYRRPAAPWADMVKLGSGAFASVYAIDDTRVLKVVQPNRESDNYDRYAQLAMANRDNPYLPNIYYRGEWNGQRVYVMEALNSTEYEDDSRAVESIHDIFNTLKCRNDVLSSFGLTLTLTDTWLQTAFDMLVEHDLMGDVCGQNIMRRKDGHLVITDPCAG